MKLSSVMSAVLLLTAFLISSSLFAQNDSLTDRDEETLAVALPSSLKEALQGGVSLAIQVELVYITPRFLLDNHSLNETHQFHIAHHTLSNRYMVHRDQETRPQLFATLDGLQEQIGVEAIRLMEQYIAKHRSIAAQSSAKPHLRLALNKAALPGPVRLSAFISKQWDFDTGWILWDFDN